MHQLQALALYLLYHHTQYLLLGLLVLRQEHQSRAILSLLRHGDALQQDKLVGYLQHDARTVAVLSDFRPTVPHVLQHFQRIVYQFVALVAVYVHHHAHAAGIVLVSRLIESSLGCLSFTFCHIILT